MNIHLHPSKVVVFRQSASWNSHGQAFKTETVMREGSHFKLSRPCHPLHYVQSPFPQVIMKVKPHHTTIPHRLTSPPTPCDLALSFQTIPSSARENNQRRTGPGSYQEHGAGIFLGSSSKNRQPNPTQRAATSRLASTRIAAHILTPLHDVGSKSILRNATSQAEPRTRGTWTIISTYLITLGLCLSLTRSSSQHLRTRRHNHPAMARFCSAFDGASGLEMVVCIAFEEQRDGVRLGMVAEEMRIVFRKMQNPR